MFDTGIGAGNQGLVTPDKHRSECVSLCLLSTAVAVHAAQYASLTEPCLLPRSISTLGTNSHQQKQRALMIDHPYRTGDSATAGFPCHSASGDAPASAVVQPSPADTPGQAMAQPGQAAIAEALLVDAPPDETYLPGLSLRDRFSPEQPDKKVWLAEKFPLCLPTRIAY